METLNKKVFYRGSKWCCVPQCKFKDGDTLHPFPKDKNLRKNWIIALRIGKAVTQCMFVCASHFNKDDFMPRGEANFNKRRRLKKHAVSSVNLPKRPLDRILSPLETNKIMERTDRMNKRNIQRQKIK